jgi:hypothetical protein
MSGNNDAQAEMDRLFGIREPQVIVPCDGDAKSRRDSVYSQALVAAQTAFPNDGVAQHRFAKRSAERLLQVSAAVASPRRGAVLSQKILVDQAFLEVFDGMTGGPGMQKLKLLGTFPDCVVAVGMGGEVYKIKYVVGVDGVTFGAPQIAESTDEEAQSVRKG